MDDGALVKLIRSGGDRDAFGALVERHQARIVRLCYGVAGNMPDAEDLAHEGFVEAYLKLDQLRDPARFAPWLRMIALNLCRMWYRQRRDSPIELADDVPDTVDDDGALADRLNSGLAQLSASHRLAVVLHHCEGLSYEDTAHFLNVPVGTVMSRLHRARTQLKRITEEMLNQEKMTNTSGFDFKREVEVEIDALLTLFNENPEAMERLSIILNNAPERFADLIRRAGDAAAQVDLALLLRRLGHAGIDVTVDCYLSPDEDLSTNAAVILACFIANGKAGVDTPYATRIAARGAYLVVDTVTRSSANAAKKAQLLADLLLAAPDDRASLLFMNALLCYDEFAMNILVDRAHGAQNPEDLYGQTGTLHALSRLGTRFAPILTTWLRTGDDREKSLALAGAEALAKSLSPGWLDMGTITDSQVLLEQRFRFKWAPPVSAYRDPAILNDLMDSVAGLAESGNAEHRDSALRVLGLLKSSRHADLFRSGATHPALSTRLAALRAFGDFGDPNTGDVLLAATDSNEPAERRVAAEILGRLKVPSSLPRLTDMLRDIDPQVRKVAVTAIGEHEGPEARAILEGLLRSSDRQLVKAAASALYGNTSRHHPEASGLDYYHVPDAQGTIGDRMRGGVEPPYFIALDAAIRAVPEPKPYDETTFSKIIAKVCYDFACTRRFLVEEGLTRREGNHYHFTEIGTVVWRVERFIRDRSAELAARG